jgi:hypothetical protein
VVKTNIGIAPSLTSPLEGEVERQSHSGGGSSSKTLSFHVPPTQPAPSREEGFKHAAAFGDQ